MLLQWNVKVSLENNVLPKTDGRKNVLRTEKNFPAKGEKVSPLGVDLITVAPLNLTVLLLWTCGCGGALPLPRSAGVPAAGIVPGGSAKRRLMISSINFFSVAVSRLSKCLCLRWLCLLK